MQRSHEKAPLLISLSLVLIRIYEEESGGRVLNKYSLGAKKHSSRAKC